MSREESPVIQSCYLNKAKCDKILDYIGNFKDFFIFEGDETPHGHYNVKISYNESEEKEMSTDEIKKRYKNLLDIIIGEKKGFDN